MSYSEYYKRQAGTGIAGFEGYRYQRGNGFFGRLLSRALPVMKFLGKKALAVGADIATDALINKKNLKETALEKLENEGRELAKEGIDRVKKYAGKGRKRKLIKETELEKLMSHVVKKKAKSNKKSLQKRQNKVPKV